MTCLGVLNEYLSGMHLAAYFNLDMNALDVEAGFPVARRFEGKDDIKPGVISGGKFLSTIHIGSYDSVKLA
jgi:effector-binding domain-containing protein